MPIPTTKSTPTGDLSKLLTLLYGAPKSGKSTLAAQFPEACFLATEKGLESLSVSRWEADGGRYVITSWEEFLAATAEVIASARFKTLVIDTIGNVCALCEQHICAKHGEEYKSDGKLGYGKGAALIVNELKRYFTKLSSVGVGVVLIAHSTTKTISTRTGEVQKTVPFIPGDNKKDEIYNVLMGMSDLVLYCEQQPGDGKRALRTKPHPTYDAGDRTGRLPDPVECSYAALRQAFAVTNAAPTKAA
mgnify:CR=1 FL=1